VSVALFAVIFEFWVNAARREDYLSLAAALRPDVDGLEGFLGIERFANVARPEHMASLSTWRDEAAIVQWRGFPAHRAAQSEGRARVFDDYRLRVGEAVDMGGSVRVSEGRALSGDGALFASIVTPGKMLLLGGAASGDVSRSFGVRIVRDYGMFERAEAPQIDPPQLR
jgi:heme-degrading monooxygenase HmoA